MNPLNTIIIGFGYKSRQGKDYAVQAILDAYKGEYDIRRYSFAQALKQEVNDAANKAGGMFALFTKLQLSNTIPDWVKYDPDADMSDPDSPLGKQRTLLQWWGTDFRRKSDPYYWVKQLDKRIRCEVPQIALVSDVRFRNEAYWVKSLEGFMVKVSRTGYVDLSGKADHQSEHDLDNFTFDVDITCGDGQVDQLRSDAVAAFQVIKNYLTPEAVDMSVESFEGVVNG